MSKIIIEEAKNQTEESIPLFRKYYIGFYRVSGCDWMQAGCDLNKDTVLQWLRGHGNIGIDQEFKIISIELPY